MSDSVLTQLVKRLAYQRIGDFYERRRRPEMTSDDKEDLTNAIEEIDDLIRRLPKG